MLDLSSEKSPQLTILSSGEPPKVRDLKRRDRPNNNPRQRWFEDLLRSIATQTDSPRVPWRFRAQDGTSWQLDKGAVGHAMANGVLVTPHDLDHVLHHVELHESSNVEKPKPQSTKRLGDTVILNRLTSPTAVKAAISECDSLGRDRFLAEYGFKMARSYVLRFQDAEYDSKAIAAVAFGYQYGTRPLRSEECSGGKNAGHAAWALDRLGFHVTGMSHVGWWLEEVEPTVDVYFQMMVLTKAGSPFKKSAFLKRLHEANLARSLKAYEFRFQNISAVLHDLGQPWLDGYAPKSQYQKLLQFVVEDRVGRRAGSSTPMDIDSGVEAAPARGVRLSKIDWARRDAENRELGRNGELYVLHRERQRLIDAGRADLSTQVQWLADEADGHGYDIGSFDPDGTPIQIEVKTTTRDRDTPFFVSRNEVSVSKIKGDTYRLHRVYRFLTAPDVAVHRGPIEDSCMLDTDKKQAERVF